VLIRSGFPTGERRGVSPPGSNQASGASVAALLLCVLVGIVLGTGAFTVHYAEGFSYLSSDPKACVNCHIMRDQYDGWQKASHHAVATCNDCHVPHEFVPKYLVKAENGLWHSKGFTFQDFPEPIRIRPVSLNILQANCVHCHHDLVNDILGHGSESANCVHCHAAVGHGPQR
jgi:cytochrome c nitrite reductase small subunit